MSEFAFTASFGEAKEFQQTYAAIHTENATFDLLRNVLIVDR